MKSFNWDHKLVRFAERERGRDYIWGETDCASLVQRALQVIYDEDKFPDAPGWTTEIGAKRAIRKVENVRDYVLNHGGVKADDNFKSSGDIVYGLSNQNGMPGLGIVVDVNKILTSAPNRGVYLTDYHQTEFEDLLRV